jgi:glycosyltransferase involved in cell wall biosynthesis
VVAGGGLEEQALRAIAGTKVTFAGRVSDTELHWLYARCHGLVAASHEDFGLTPLEAAGFGKPTAALRWGGFLDTIEEGTNGAFFDEPTPSSCAAGIRAVLESSWMNRRFERSPRDSRRDASLNAYARRPSRCDEPSPLRMGAVHPLPNFD